MTSTKGDGQDRALPPAEDRAVVNGAASVSALRASVPSALRGLRCLLTARHLWVATEEYDYGGWIGECSRCGRPSGYRNINANGSRG